MYFVFCILLEFKHFYRSKIYRLNYKKYKSFLIIDFRIKQMLKFVEYKFLYTITLNIKLYKFLE